MQKEEKPKKTYHNRRGQICPKYLIYTGQICPREIRPESLKNILKRYDKTEYF
jgi:hypothetical protein